MDRIKKNALGCFVTIFAAAVSAAMLLPAVNASAANWPEKGKVITILVPSGAGGGADMSSRAFQPYLEKELGTKIIIVNKAGGGTQIGAQEYVAKAGTDGYMLLYAITPNMPAHYMDPDRKATYTRE